MVEKPSSDTQDMFDDLSNDLASSNQTPPSRRGTISCADRFSSNPKIILGVALLLVIILFAFLFSGSKGASTEDVKAINLRLDQMEKRLASLDATEKKMSSLENQLQGFQQALSRHDSADRSLRERIDKLSQQLEKAAAPPAPPQPKQGVKPSPAKSAPPQGGVRYHEVASGDTLYHIANRYGTTVGELRRLNNLKPGEAITPGQKLAVTPNRP